MRTIFAIPLRTTICLSLVFGWLFNIAPPTIIWSAYAQQSCTDDATETQDFKKAREVDTRRAYDDFVRRYPFGCFSEEADQLRLERGDEEAWKTARRENKKASYQLYMDDYGSSGRYFQKALEALANLDNTQTARQLNPFEGVVLSGPSIGRSTQSKVSTCEASCQKNSLCKAYSYGKTTKLCSLLSKVVTAVPNSDFLSGSAEPVTVASAAPQPRVIDPSPVAPEQQTEVTPDPVQPTQPRAQTNILDVFRFYTATDFPGSDLAGFKNLTSLQCASRCRQDNRCVAFTYNVPNRSCFLKNRAGSRTYAQDAYSGIKR